MIICLFLIVMQPKKVTADEETEGMGFSVSPAYPKTQLDSSLGYYYLQTTPNEPQKIELLIASQKKETQKIRMHVQDAYTGLNGGLEFGLDGEPNFKQDETLKNPISSIIKPDVEEIELKGNEQKKVTFTITPPEGHYDGIKLGQLVFQPVEEEGENGIGDVYRYATSVILSESGDEFDNGELASLALNEVKPVSRRGRRMVVANLQNPQPKRIVNLDMDAVIKEKGKSEVVQSVKMSNFQFAPNSNVDFEMNWGVAELVPGDYTFELKAKNEYDEIKLQKDFRITASQAKDINEKSAFKIKTPDWVKIVAIIDGIIVLIISIVIFSRNKKWHEISKKKRRQTQRKKTKKGKK